jgi:hypothetical protein
MVKLILQYSPAIEEKDRDFKAAPLGWAIHASIHGWHPDTGDYAGTAKVLLQAGAISPEKPNEVETTDAVRAVLKRFGGLSKPREN